MSLAGIRWCCTGYLARVLLEPLIAVRPDTDWPHRALAGSAGWLAIEAALYVGVRIRRALWRRRMVGAGRAA